MPISSPYDFITKDDQLMNYIFSSMKQPSFNAMGGGGGSYQLPSGVNIPKVKLPDINLPGIQGPDLGIKAPELNLKTPSLNLPSINLPNVNLPQVNLPNIGLPSIQLPQINLPELNLPKVPLPSAGGLGYDLKTGQVTYKPTPTQAIQTAADLAKITGQTGLGQTLGAIAPVVGTVAAVPAMATAIGKVLEWLGIGAGDYTYESSAQTAAKFAKRLSGMTPSEIGRLISTNGLNVFDSLKAISPEYAQQIKDYAIEQDLINEWGTTDTNIIQEALRRTGNDTKKAQALIKQGQGRLS